MQPILTVIGFMIIYGVFHSLTAAFGFKDKARQLMGERLYLGTYRLGYSFISILTLLPIMVYVGAHSGKAVWHIEMPYSLGLFIVQIVGGIGLLISIWQIDGMRFLGIRQLFAYLNNDPLPLPPEPLETGGLYRLVRHPLYFFSMVVLWAVPTMTEASLGFILGISLYFIIGSLWEERKLRQVFGDAYREYQTKVPWLIPFIKF